MSTATIWALILGMGAITYALRVSMIVLLGRVEIPPVASRALRFVPAAVFSALIGPAIARPDGPVWISPANPYLLAAGLAVVVAWRSKQMVLTIVLGMAALWLVR